MITITNLSKHFRTEDVETIALDNVSFEVKDGEFVAIMGPSGCGKSTLLNILGLLDNPTSGTYLLGDRDVSQLRERDRTNVRKGEIGFVFQSFNLIDELTVAENIELPLTYLNMKAGERKERVQQIMKRMAISHRGWLFPLSELRPRMTIRVEPPIPVPDCAICTPAILPCSMLAMLTFLFSVRPSVLTSCMA